jgi:hypothetical protein
MRLTSDLEMPLAPPRASTRASTFRVEMPPGVGLHHHGVEGLVDPAARLKPVGEGAALPKFEDGEGEVTHLGGQHPFALAIAVRGAFIGPALMELGADGG